MGSIRKVIPLTLTLSHQGRGDQTSKAKTSLPPCGGELNWGGKKRNFLYGLIILTLILLVLPAAVTAQVNMEVRLGFQGTIQLDKRNPLTVNLENTGPTLTGTLGVSLNGSTEADGSRTLFNFTRQVELPYQTRKRFTLSIPIDSLAAPIGVFFRRNERVLVQQRLDLRAVFNAEYIILGLTRDFDLDFLAATIKPHTRLVYLSALELPQHWSEYDSISAIVLKGVPLNHITDKQSDALRKWIARGGTLVVASDSQYTLLQEPRLRDLLPVQILGIQQMEGLHDFSEHYGFPMPEKPLLAVQARLTTGQVLVGSAELPLLAQRPFGKGRVVFLAVDYAASPLTGWPGNTALWREILQPVETMDISRVYAELGFSKNEHPVMKLLEHPVLKYPSHLSLLVFLITYGGSLGIFFAWLRKGQVARGRSWIIFLLITLAFSGLAYRFFSEPALSQAAFLFDLTVMEVLPNTGYAHAHGYIGLFSPLGGQFSLSLQHPGAILQQAFQPGPKRANQVLGIDNSEIFSIHGITLQPWSLQVLSLESMVAAPVRGMLRRNSTGLTVDVKNLGPLPLKGTILVYRGQIYSLGTIWPGQEILEDIYESSHQGGIKEELVWQALEKSLPVPDDPNLSQSQKVLLQQHFGGKLLSQMNETPVLTGWLISAAAVSRETKASALTGTILVVGQLNSI